jgi:hypothetical protein
MPPVADSHKGSTLDDEPVRDFDCPNCGASLRVPIRLLMRYPGQTVTRWCSRCRRLVDLRMPESDADR